MSSTNTTDVSISITLFNAIIFTVIVILREDPLSTGMLDVFFRKNENHVSLLLREILKSEQDQIKPHFFVPINGTNIYISSIKFLLNGPILMEL